MSTKIHNGYKFDLSPFDAIPLIEDSFKEIRGAAARRFLYEFVSRKYDSKKNGLKIEPVELVDLLANGPFKMDSKTLHTELVEAQYLKTMLAPTIVWVKNGDLGALFYDTHNVYTDAWEQLDFVREFRYWNNTDKPDNLTAIEWEDRGVWWNGALGRLSPAQSGVTWSLVDNLVWHDAKPRANDKPSDSSRLRELVNILKFEVALKANSEFESFSQILTSAREIEVDEDDLIIEDVDFPNMLEEICVEQYKESVAKIYGE